MKCPRAGGALTDRHGLLLAGAVRTEAISSSLISQPVPRHADDFVQKNFAIAQGGCTG